MSKLTIEQVRERLRAACDEAGSMRAWADGHGMSAAFVSDVLKGLRRPGDRMLAALGIERTIVRDVIYRDAGTGPGRAKEGDDDA